MEEELRVKPNRAGVKPGNLAVNKEERTDQLKKGEEVA